MPTRINALTMVPDASPGETRHRQLQDPKIAEAIRLLEAKLSTPEAMASKEANAMAHEWKNFEFRGGVLYTGKARRR